MMSQIDTSLDKGTTPRLPVLKDGQNSLVSAEPRPAPPTPRERASDWALEVRKRINVAIEQSSQVPEEDIRQLKQELVPVFVVCLQQDSRIGWSYLTEVLDLLEPYSEYLDFFEIKAEMYHYLERTYQHVQTHKERLFDLHITEAMAKVFPKEIAQLKDSESRPLKNYCVTIPAVQLSSEPPSPKIRKLVPTPPNLRSLPDGTNPYSMYINTEEQLQKVKQLTFGDLRKSIANVAVDMATRESIWSRPYGPVAQALYTEIPEDDTEKKSPEREEPGFKLTPRSGVANFTAAERKFKKTPRIEDEAVPIMTGRDAVRYFVECHHTGQIKSLFFNYAPNRHYRPYDLVCVHKNKVNPDHFVFSTFGVLHVTPNSPNQSMELGEWQREAVLWTAVASIPFFKNYLIKKMFDRWRSNKLYLDYLRRSQELASTLLPAVPAFGAALLQVMRLLKELITVNFLPFETDKTYQLSDFENNVNYKNIQAEKLLEKFFKYCKMVVDVTAEESFGKLHYCEEQVKKKSYFTKDSLHMQKVKKEQREENLRLAKSETGRLGNFVKLVDQMIVEHMFHLTKTQVMTFVNSALIIGTEAPREGFFKANLVFTKQDVLGISPTKEKFIKVLNNTLKGIPSVLCANAVGMDGSVVEALESMRAETQTGADDTDAVKSSSELKHPPMERKKSITASLLSSTGKAGTTSRTQMSEAVTSQMGDTMTVISMAQTEVPLSKTTKSVVDDDGTMKVPDLPRQPTFTKTEDDLGVATPDLVVRDEGQDLVVEGEGFMGQYRPLTKASLEEKLEKDADFQSTLGAMSEVLKAALEEIDEYCDYNKWLNEINIFCKKWTDRSVKELKGEAAFTIEQKLTELRQWSEKVRHFDHNFLTENGLFYIDCSLIHENLLPKLNDIYLEIVTFVADEAKNLANNFCAEMKTILQNLKEKQNSVDCFADYAKNFNMYKKNTSSYQQKVEYIKSLYEVIRMSYRQLTPEEEKYEENVWAAWEAFLLQMQDASEFVNTQTPLMTQLLEDTYQRVSSGKSRSTDETDEEESIVMKLEKEAYELMEVATSGKFLDPSQNPTHILIAMKRLRDKFYSIQKQLQQASKWRDAICGEPYDLTFLNEMTVTMDVRQELWKYVEVSTHAIKDWKQMLFKKMNIRKALEKVIEWQAAASQLKPYLPVQDKVLTTWFKTLQEFKKDLPVLHKLANDALKERHWKAIFVGMNESYDPKREFTVADLLTYDLEEHAQLIHSIYLGAVAEYDLELKIGYLKKFWEEREFKLAKHIPDSLLQSKDDEENDEGEPGTAKKLRELKSAVRKKKLRREPKKDVSPRRRTKLEKYRQEKAAAANVGTFQGLNVADDDYFILIEVEELKYQLEDSRISICGMMQSPFLGDMSTEVTAWSSSLQQDSRISIRGMMQSPFLGDMSTEVTTWSSSLQQVEEITDLWYTCQKKWMYLLKVFEWPELYKRFQKQAPKFESAHTKFKDWMRIVSNDSKVLTVINRRRGEKGYRLLQGDNLRSLFLELIQTQEEILKHLSSLMENCRMEFTRLYFLSDEEMVDMMGVSRNPQALLPFAKKCFPGIKSLAFALPPGTASLNTHLDFALHADKLQVIAMRGLYGEEVPFFAHLEAQSKSTRWLKLLEGIMKNTMATILQACVQARMEESSKQPVHLLDELRKVYSSKVNLSEDASEDASMEITHSFQHWLLRFPVQCVVVAEGILWARRMTRLLDRPDVDADDLKYFRMNGTAKLEQYLELLKEVFKLPLPLDVRNRLHILLSTLVNQSIDQRQVLDALIAEPVVSEKSFEWLKMMRYQMDIRNVLRAKTEAVESGAPPVQTDPVELKRKMSRTRRTSQIAMKARMAAIEEPPKPIMRTKTSVSNDYQFSPCSVQQLSNTFMYNYEYIGPRERLLLTPLTQRAFLSLTQALKNFHCGTLIGPAGRGKSETIKDLAKIFGQNLFVVNCNEELTLPMMTQYMMGMVQSGCWALFDDTDRLTKGLMSVTAQHLDYLRTALRTLDASSENQYKIRGQPRSDKKTGVGDAVIRRNSLTTLHPLPNASTSPQFERQKTVPHGFNEKGLVTYFEETWVAEKEQRRHSIEREIEIKESELYNKNKPPPLFYEHARFKGKKASPDYSKLFQEAIYKPGILGNVMFQGKLLPASASFGCFMTLNTDNPAAARIPETYRVLLRPCALVCPDLEPVIETTLLCYGFSEHQRWAKKLTLFVKLVKMQLPRKNQYDFGLKDIKIILQLAAVIHHELQEAQAAEKNDMEEAIKQTGARMDTPPLVAMKPQGLEEQSIIQAIVDIMQPTIENEDDLSTFFLILQDIFPLSRNSKSASSQYQDTKLVNAVRDQLNEDNVKETQEIMDKILQLYASIQQKEPVILAGPSGSGKSTSLCILSRALNRLNALLFAPDHSKDELTAERDFMYHAKQKLQDLDMEEFLAAEKRFLNKMGPKTETTKGGKKFRRMTSMLTKVQEAIHEMEVKKTPEYAMYPKIDVVRLNPTALSVQELLGHFEDGMWQGGLFPKILRDSSFLADAVKTYLSNYNKEKQKGKQELPSILLRWIVMDGVLNPSWTEGLNTVVDCEKKLSMANCGQVAVNIDSTQLMFETTDLTNASPSVLSHCSLIHFGEDTVQWQSLFDCWAKTAKSKWIFTTACMKVIIDLVLDVFGPTIKFLNNECSTALLTDVGHDATMRNKVVPGIQEVTSFIMMYSALLDRGFSRDEFEKKIRSREPDDLNKTATPSSMGGTTSRMTTSSQIEQTVPHYMDMMKHMFAIAYIWAFGGSLHDRYREKFSKFAHDVLYRATHPIRMPLPGTVFDYTLEDNTGNFIRWNQKAQERTKSLAGGFIVTPEVEKYSYLMDLLLGSHQPVLVTGMPGVGKTSILQNMVVSKQPSTTITMSPGMTSAIFQEALMAHILDLKSKAFNVMASGQPAVSKAQQKHLFFIDDLNTASQTSGYQPPLELLTQIISQGGVYDRQRQEFQPMEEALIVAAATLPTIPGVGMGQSCHVISSRLTRLFFNLHIFSPNPEGILSTFGRSIQHWLEEFPTYSVEHHFEFARALTLGLLELYQKVKEKFRPTPTHAHYIFSLHDISRVVQGILLMSPRSRTRKMMKIKKDKKSGSLSRQTSRGSTGSGQGGQGADVRGRGSTSSLPGQSQTLDGPSPPMMKVIAQLWCHECTRTFADRLVTEEDHQWYARILEEIVVKQFCSPREDPKTEMAAISEETFSQTGHVSPHGSPPPPPLSPSDSGDEEETMEPRPGTENLDQDADIESSRSTSNSDPAKSASSKATSRASSKASKASSKATSRASTVKDDSASPDPSTIGQSIPLDLDQVEEGTDRDTRASTRPNEGLGPGAATDTEYETEEDSEDSSTDGETTETETDTLAGTPRDFDNKGTSYEDSSRGTSRTSAATVTTPKTYSSLRSYSTSKTHSSTYKYTSSSEVSSEVDSDRLVALQESGKQKKTQMPEQADIVSRGAARLKRQSSQQRGSMGTNMRHVHFKPGLMADREHVAYFGPLMKLEEVKGSKDNLTDFIFSKFYMTTHTETNGLSVEKGYVDTTEETLCEALQTCLNVYNIGTSQRLELVFFKQAIRHAARLSRVLALQGGHAILLGTSYSTGRATLVRLAAYVAHCKSGKIRQGKHWVGRHNPGTGQKRLYEPKPQTDPLKNLRIVQEHIKRACHHTGILCKPTVLLVHEDLGMECLQDVAALMATGTSPGLYTDDELQSIVSQMMPGGVQTKRIDKIEQAFERFLKRIRQNLHVVVCLSYRGNCYSSDFKSLHGLVSNYPQLIKYSSSIDHFQPWPFEAYVKMANVWLQDDRSKVYIPWHPTRRLEQVEMTSKAMAYMHLSARMAIERQYCHQKEPLRFFSPLTFMEFVHVFRIISAYIVKMELSNIQKHERALGKVNEAFGSISEFKREVSDLSPQHKEATDEIKQLVEEVEAHKQDYIVALDKCKEQEQEIEELQGPLEKLRKEAQSEFDKMKKFKEENHFLDYYTVSQYKLNPNYKAAMQALGALDIHDIEEVKSFREPPELVRHVVNALCLLFDKPQDWENGKLLLTKENFIQELIFYDKDNIPVRIFRELSRLVKDPQFDPWLVMSVSRAASGICQWVHAVQKYSDIHRNMQPRLKNLLEQEEKFTRAQAKLGHLRVEANRIKSGLERKIQVHKTAVKRAKTILKHMQNIERKIARAVNLMENMSMQHYLWKSELRKAKHQIFTAPGDALVTAACVLYHGPLSDKYRAELLQDWLDRCKQGIFQLPKAIGQEVYPLTNALEGLYDYHKEKDSISEVSSSQTGETPSETGGILSLPQIKMYKYQPVVYDTSKYYKSELKRHGSVEYEQPANMDDEDSDDETEQSPLLTRAGYTLQDILSEFDELSKWRLDNLPTDLHSVQNALLVRVSCYNRKHCWPLLIDPDNQAEMWVKAVQTSSNIFSEKDVRDGDLDETEELPPVPSSDGNKDSTTTPLPPSRGTGITFSDYTYEYHPDDDDGTNMSSRTYTTDYTKSIGRLSRNSWNSEELRPVTSVTASWEMYSLHPDQSIDHPENNLWIIEADDPTLDSRLINAIVHGVTVLVTHLERKPIDPLFRGLLLKHFYVDKDGHKVVRVGTHEFRYHPNFSLYLSTSVPLFLRGDGLHGVPIHRMCIINMAMSDEAIINYLLSETMRVERKEFEGQKRSNENDIILHRQRLAKEHEMIREKTLNLFGPLLEDQTMLNSLISCQKEVERNKMILEETRYMGDHLEEKFSAYVPMIMQSAMLYNMIKAMSVLHPYYYMPFYKFVEMFVNVIKARDRGKGTQGAPSARATELCDAIYTEMFKYVSMMMFEQHFLLLQLLVSIERMRLCRKASTKELGLFLNGFDKQGIDEAALLDMKPGWIEGQAWIDCIVLEQLHHSFHGLRKSFTKNSEQWNEYFQHPVALMNTVPGTTLQELSIFQKCLLWKFAAPSRLSEVANALILYELGSIRTIPDHYNIREVYNFGCNTTPVVFVLPNDIQDPEAADGTKGLPYVSPAHEVKRLAKEVGMEGKVRVMNFGVDGQVKEATQALEDCLQSGYWLLLQNYHLAEEPEVDFFQLLKDIVYSKWMNKDTVRQDTSVADESSSLVTHSKSKSIKSGGLFKVPSSFRLWITTQSDVGRLIPGVLVQHGMKVTAESTGNFKSTLQKSYRSVAFLLNNFRLARDETNADRTARIMPLALLHSLLLQQCYYGNGIFQNNHHWSLTDVAMAVDMYKKVMYKCGKKEGVAELVSQIYTDHCVDQIDHTVVESLVRTLSKLSTITAKELMEAPEESIVNLVKKLMYFESEVFNLRRAVDSMEELSARLYGLPDAADLRLIEISSSILGKDMVQVIGAPELFIRVTTGNSSAVLSRDQLIPQYLSLLQNLPTMPDTNRNQVYPVDVCLHFEVVGYNELIAKITSDLNLLQRRAKGEILPDSNMDDVVLSLNKNTVPPSWTAQSFPSTMNLSDWMNELPIRMKILKSYIMDEKPATYNLSAFLRPDRFLESVKQTYARRQFKDIDCIALQVEVMPNGFKPSLPPGEGAFISGLRLHNALWDATRSVLMMPTPDSSPDQEVPIFWLKPLDSSSPSRARILYKLYRCPVYCSTDSRQHGDSNVVVHFSLPSQHEASVWQHQRVFLSTKVPKAD